MGIITSKGQLICNIKNVVYLIDKFSVITNALQVWTVYHYLTNFGQNRQIFKCTGYQQNLFQEKTGQNQ